jgi:hypothetical protein
MSKIKEIHLKPGKLEPPEKAHKLKKKLKNSSHRE